jgi:endo-1,4-beta-mannosidase
MNSFSNFTLGLNYWPRRKAMYWWSDFDPAEVDEEFSQIASLGLNVVRIFLLWDDFQPDPTRVDETALANLVTVADTAARHGLGLDVTFFTGHMSGPNWAPRWLLGDDYPSPYFQWVNQLISRGEIVPGGYRNPFSDPEALDAERLLLETVVNLLKDHPGVWMWNLGNEPDLFAWPPSAQMGRQWVREMTGLIKRLDPVHPVTCGLHGDSLHHNNGLRVDYVFAETDVAVMHGYPMYSDWSRSPLDPDFVPFLCALTASLSGKPVLMEEFGGCTEAPGKASNVCEWTSYGQPRTQFMASEEDLAEYLRQSLANLHASGATGAMLWCYADYIPELWELPPCKESRHERFFGLVRPNGSLKPHALVLKEFAARQPLVQPIPDWARLDVHGDNFYRDDPTALLPGLYNGYLARRPG